jgi:hypothetical protein
MRNISFALTTRQFLDGSKTVTRRLGWKNLQPGQRLRACEKCMGLKKGEKIKPLGEIEVVSVKREPLAKVVDEYGQAECQREGFPDLRPEQFVQMFCKHMKCHPTDVVTRIAFRRVE